MADVQPTLRSGGSDLGTRQKLAFDRIQQLIDEAELRAQRASRNYFSLQVLTIALAAITPCLIFLAKDNPRNEVLNWLQIFFPALAAVAAGASHAFHWREDAVRNTGLAQSIRSQLWRFQTRTGEFAPKLSDDQALDRLVVQVDELNLKSIARWSSEQLSQAPPAAGAASAPAHAAEP
jgi:hypothetical protein